MLCHMYCKIGSAKFLQQSQYFQMIKQDLPVIFSSAPLQSNIFDKIFIILEQIVLHFNRMNFSILKLKTDNQNIIQILIERMAFLPRELSEMIKNTTSQTNLNKKDQR